MSRYKHKVRHVPLIVPPQLDPDAQEFSDAYNTHRDLMLQSKLAELPAVPENGLQEEGDRVVQKQDETKLTATCEIEHPSPRRTAYRPLKVISA